MKITIVEVAKEAGVSVSTVSRVLNNQSVTPGTRKKVLDASKKLNYIPNVFAHGIRGQKRGGFGLIISNVKDIRKANPWISKMMFCISQNCSAEGYHLMVELWNHSGKNGVIPKLVSEKRVDGCFLLGHYPDNFYKEMEKESNIPLITYSERMPYSRGISIKVKNKDGMKRGVEYLFAMGHERIGMVWGKNSPSSRERYEGFMEAMGEFQKSVDDEIIITAEEDNDFKSGYNSARKILANDFLPTAIVFSNDIMAIGGMEAAKEKGLKIPDDISIMGWDNIEMGELVKPTLTTISPDHLELSRIMVMQLERMVHKQDENHDVWEVGVELIKRGSTKNISP